MYADIEDTLLARSATLYSSLDASKKIDDVRKKELLSELLNRAITKIQSQDGV